MGNKIIVTMVTVLMMLSTIAFANPFISYVGRFTHQDGQAVGGNADISIKFYDAASGGNQLGSTLTYPDTPLNDGVFQVNISMSTADWDNLFPDVSVPVYIEIEDTANNITTPRQQFSIVPYALKVPVDGTTISYDANGALQANPSVSDLSDVDTSGLAGGQVLKWDGSKWVAGNDTGAAINANDVLSTHISDGTIVNADISATAAIASSKISGFGTAATKDVGTGATQVSAGDHAHAGTYEAANANIQTHVGSAHAPSGAEVNAVQASAGEIAAGTEVTERSWSPQNIHTMIDTHGAAGGNDTAYNATSWNTNLDAPTKNVVRDKIETMQALIDTNTGKTSYTDAAAVAANTAKVSYTDAAAVAANTAKVSYTDAAAVAANTAKVSYTDAAAVTLNTAKNTYPGADATKLSAIAAGAEVNAAQISAGEITAGSVTAERSWSPQDVHTMIDTHGGGGADDTAYNATSWNANTAAPTKNVVRDKVETMQALIDTNTAKTSYTAAAAVAANTAKVSYTDAAAVASNTAKNTYPGADSTKVAGISAGAEVNAAQISAGEITAGSETTERSWSPQDVHTMIDTHGSGGANDTAYNEATWNANTDAPTKNVVRDKVETMQALIDTNTAKTSYTAAAAVAANTAKVSYTDAAAVTSNTTHTGNTGNPHSVTKAQLGLGTAAVLDVGTTASKIVQLDGSGKLPAVDGSALSGITVGPAGADKQVQFNSGGSTAASASFVWDHTNNRLGIGTAIPASKLDVAGDIRVGTTATGCSGTNEGAQRYNSTDKEMEYCNGTAWKSFIPALRQYCGATASPYTGSGVGGWAGAKSKCETQCGVGANICTGAEIENTVRAGNQSSISTSFLWFTGQVHWSGNQYFSSCDNFTSNGVTGNNVNYDAGAMEIILTPENCSASHQIACCK